MCCVETLFFLCNESSPPPLTSFFALRALLSRQKINDTGLTSGCFLWHKISSLIHGVSAQTHSVMARGKSARAIVLLVHCLSDSGRINYGFVFGGTATKELFSVNELSMLSGTKNPLISQRYLFLFFMLSICHKMAQ